MMRSTIILLVLCFSLSLAQRGAIREPVRDTREHIRDTREPVRDTREHIRDTREPVRDTREPVRDTREHIRDNRDPFPGTRPISGPISGPISSSVWSPRPPVGWTPSRTPGVASIWSPNPPRGWVPPPGSVPLGFSSYGYSVNPFYFNGRQLNFGALPSQLGNNNIPWRRAQLRGILPDGNYAFRSPVNNLLLQVPAWNADENAQVFLDTFYAQPNQIWYLTRIYADQPVYLVVSRSSNLVLALNNGQVVQQTYTGVASQYWRITEQDPERYQFENLSTGEAIKSGDKNGFGQENYAFQAATVTKPFASGRVDRQFNVEIPV